MRVDFLPPVKNAAAHHGNAAKAGAAAEQLEAGMAIPPPAVYDKIE